MDQRLQQLLSFVPSKKLIRFIADDNLDDDEGVMFLQLDDNDPTL